MTVAWQLIASSLKAFLGKGLSSPPSVRLPLTERLVYAEAMPLSPEELTAAVEYLRTLLADKQDRLRGEIQFDYLAKKRRSVGSQGPLPRYLR